MTVTSIGISGSQGVTSSGGPITTSGTINVGLGDITPNSVTIGQAAGSDGLTFTNQSLIRGDFSSALLGRTYFKSTAANSRTLVPAVANGTAGSNQFTGFIGFGDSNPTNNAYVLMGISEASGVAILQSSKNGTGTAVPLNITASPTIGTGITIDTSGNTAVKNNLTVSGFSTFSNQLTLGTSGHQGLLHMIGDVSTGAELYMTNTFNSAMVDINVGNNISPPYANLYRSTGGVPAIGMTAGDSVTGANLGLTNDTGTYVGVLNAGTSTSPSSLFLYGLDGFSSAVLGAGDGATYGGNLEIYAAGTVGGVEIHGNGPAGSPQYPQVTLQNTFDGTTSISINSGGAATGIGTTEQPQIVMYGLDTANDGFLVTQIQAPGVGPTTVSFLAGNHSPSTPTNMEFYASSGKVIVHSLEIAEKVTTTSSVSGNATLVAGAVTVSSSAITANSVILLTVGTLGTVTVPKAVNWQNRVAGTSFQIVSADPTDTSTVSWFIIG